MSRTAVDTGPARGGMRSALGAEEGIDRDGSIGLLDKTCRALGSPLSRRSYRSLPAAL